MKKFKTRKFDPIRVKVNLWIQDTPQYGHWELSEEMGLSSAEKFLKGRKGYIVYLNKEDAFK